MLGGNVSPDQVGIMGLSMGGFTVLDAFGLESRVQAAWVDGAPSEPRHVFWYGLTQRAENV